MEKKFHVVNGEAKPCTASVRNCPIGGEHFTSVEDARASVEVARKKDDVPLPSQKNLTKVSKKLSYLLRHAPESAGITLTRDGYARVSEITSALNINRSTLQAIVDADNKGRYSYADNGNAIRANQGHSIKVDLGYDVVEAPSVLYHGTSNNFLDSIMSSGINAGQRHAVHLSENLDTAWNVAERRNNPIVLVIDSARMNDDGVKFTRSDNGVWLTNNVATKYIGDIIWNKD